MNNEPEENAMNRTAEQNRTTHRQRGLSLVEIMVALAVGAVLLTGVIQIYASTKATYRLQDNLARLQENGRFALDFLTRDVRMAGYHGCSNFGEITNTLNNPSSLEHNFTVGLTGYDDVGDPAPTALSVFDYNPVAGTDVIVIRRNSDDPVRVVKNNSSAQLFAEVLSQVPGGCSDGTNKVSGLCATDILMVSDCVKSRIFQVGNLQVTGNPPDVNITHPASGSPGNALSSWGGASAPAEEQFSDDAEIVRIGTYAYYIRDNIDTGLPVLMRYDSEEELELVEGVEDMQVSYGEDTDGDRTADVYRDADPDLDWSAVVSVRIHLLLRSKDNNLTNAPMDYVFNGATVAGSSLPASDRYLRREFTATVAVRNRAS
jgi:type IV pilus assembly protein PilW